MKKKLLYATLLGILLPIVAQAQGWPAGYGGVMLQGFFWDSYTEKPDCSPWGPVYNRQTNSGTARHKAGYTWATMYGANWSADDEEWQVPLTTWASLLSHKSEYAPYIDLLWLPQSGSTVAPATTTYEMKGDGRGGVRAWRRGDGGSGTWGYNEGVTITNPDCMGFVPVFYFHHGLTMDGNAPWTYHFNNIDWTPMSYFGTEAELRELISTLKADGTYCIEDVVANHRGGLGTWTGDANSIDFPAEYYKGELIEWTSADVCSDDESGRGTGGDDCGGPNGRGQWARDIQHHSPATQAKVAKYLEFLKEDLGYAGYRWDYARGFEPKHFGEYNVKLRPTFSVGEFWGSDDEIISWIKNTYDEGNYQSGAFDFQLQEAIRSACNSTSFRGLNNVGLISNQHMKRYAVTFIDNHDTFKDLPTDGSNYDYQHRVQSNILEANAFILSMPGTPCLFWPHFMHPAWHDQIVKMIKARRTAGVTNESAVWAMEELGSDGAQWRITGTKGELYIQLCRNISSIPVPNGFSTVWQGDNGRLCIINSLADKWENSAKPTLINGYPVVDKSSGSYPSNTTVNIKPSTDGCTLVYTTTGHTPTVGSKQITDATAGETLTLTENTTVKVGVLVDGEVVNVITRNYVVDDNQSGNSINVYVQAPSNPSLYAWWGEGDDKVEYTGTFPGWTNISATERIAGINWYKATVPAGQFNMILSLGNSASQTADIKNVTSDVFYAFEDNTAYDVTTTYINSLHNPMVSIDKGSGTYSKTLTATLTASSSNAVIVYTTDGDEPTSSSAQITGSGTVTFTMSGTADEAKTLRAGILKDGQVINQVARSYTLTYEENWGESYTPSTSTSGIDVYVNASAAPYLYAWDGDEKLNGEWPGTQMSEVKLINGTKEYYHKHFDRSNISIIVNDGNGNQSADINLDLPGSYFFDYNGTTIATDVSRSSGYVTVTPNLPSAGTTIMVKSNVTPYIWAWNGSSNYTGGNWPGQKMSTCTFNGETWYYWQTPNKTWGNVIFSNNGSSQTTDISGIQAGYNFFTYTPGGSPSYVNVTSQYASMASRVNNFTQQESSSDANELPSCATATDSKYYFYFENDANYSNPYAWIYNNTTVFSGTSWPGEALVEVVGVAANGNTIFRWSYDGDSSVDPANVIFSNNGSSQKPGIGEAGFDFVNGGYYSTTGGCNGVVNQNIISLADLLKKGDTTQDYVIGNDLTCVYTDGNVIYAKDNNGDAINQQYCKGGQKIYQGEQLYQAEEYDQSNWIKLVLHTELSSSQFDKFVGHTLLAQTVIGRLSYEDAANHLNPVLTLTVLPITGKQSNFQVNHYIPANFLDNSTYYFKQPAEQEYFKLDWALLGEKDGNVATFYMPARDLSTGTNQANIPGAVRVRIPEGTPTLNEGQQYDIMGVAKRLPATQSAPRRATPKVDSPVSNILEVEAISVSALPNGLVTGVTEVKHGGKVTGVYYVNLAGMVSDKPFSGINVVVTTYDDGSRTTRKAAF
ncbi:MAG: starch-binding protein [Muribaculaceae bacterium]|nr:starch-binding protein [Muribaculaceae bacterium]